MKLRPYQEKAVSLIRESMKKHRAVCFRLDTGLGKTAIFSYISMLVESNGKNVIILVHRKNLVSQVSMAVAVYGLMHTIIASRQVILRCIGMQRKDYGEHFINPKSRIKVCMVQTVVNRPEQIQNCDLLIVDEAHHIIASNYLKVIDYLKPSAKILGVTATPKRPDGKALGDVFQDLIEVISMKEGIEQGYLCEPITFSVPAEYANHKLHKSMGDYNIKELAEDANNRKIYGDAIGHYRRLCDKVPAIAFCINIAESIKVAEDFRDAGYRAVAIYGGMDDDEINDALDGLADGRYHIVCSCDLISEGTDVPMVGCIIQLRRTLSIVLQQQQIGRGLRLYPDNALMKQPHMQCLIKDGQHVCYVIDCANNFGRFGWVHQDRTWSLDGDTELVEKTKQVATCPACFMTHYPAPVCPYCAFEYKKKSELMPAKKKETEIIDVELVEMKFSWDNPDSIKKLPYKEVITKAKSIEDLILIADAKGYKKSWVIKQIEEISRKKSEKEERTFEEVFESGLRKYARIQRYKDSWVNKQLEVRGIA
jgi:DNA repair protein RadD